MLHVDLDNIFTHDELASRADEALRRADEEGKILVITRNGRPAVAMLKLEQLEELSGRTVATATPPTEVAAPQQPTPQVIMPEAAAMPPTAPAPEVPMAEMPNPAGLPDMPS